MKRVFFLLACLLLMLTVASAEVASYESDFTSGTDGWYGRGASVLISKEGLYVGGRTATWNSPGRPFDLEPGSTYEISVDVKQTQLESGRFILSCEHARGGETSYENLAFASVPRNEWTTITATWTAGDYDTYILYVEGGEANTPFFINNFTLYAVSAAAPRAEVEREPFVMPESAAALGAYFDTLTLNESYKRADENNPLFTQRFGADPGVLVWKDRLYVYTTNDVIETNADGSVRENSYGQINKINCISSADLVNWTDHGAIPVAGRKGIASWAGNSWAPCAAHKVIDGQDRFFLYFCNGGNGVSVLTADDPAGPWTDPLGHGLITRATPNCADVLWLFDPAVFVDNDGTGYLYFGGGVPDGKAANPGTIRCVRLGDDMISIAGEPQVIDAPYAFEDSGINRIGDTYYYSYCSNWNTTGNPYGLDAGSIQYMTSTSPMGPFTYAGQVFPNQGKFFGLYGNNHHSIVFFRGQHYLVYHNRSVEQAMGITGNYRSPQIDRLTVLPDGTLQPVTGTMRGMTQCELVNPYAPVSTQTMRRQAGLEITGYADETLTVATTGDWLEISGVYFAYGAGSFTLYAGSENGGAVRVMAGDTVVCDLAIPAGTAMTEITVSCRSIVAHQNLTLIFAGDVTSDWWQFTRE